MKTIMPVSFLVALVAAIAAMPTNVYKICAWNVGTLKVEPWRRRTSGAVRHAAESLRAWFSRLWTPQVLATACLILTLLLIAQQTGSAEVLLAIPPLAAPVAEKRAQLLREAEALRSADGSFKDDATRQAFDAKMAEIEAIDKAASSAPAQMPPADDAAVRAAATTLERERITGIQHAVHLAKLEPTVAEEMVKRNLSLDQARAEIFTKLAQKEHAEQPETRSQLAVGEDARDKWLHGAMNWLLVKGGVAELVARATKADVATIDPGEFRGFTLVDLARDTLTRSGRSIRGLNKMRIVSEAFMRRDITQSTSDFATLLENTMHKVLQAAYATQPDTWRRFCATSTVSDFRAHNRYRMGSFGALDALNELGEFKHKVISDAEKATITASTKGNIITVSRQMIINDDMGAFTRLLSMLGRAAGLSVEVDVYALLALNAGLGPTQTDLSPLFDNTARGNVTTGAAISAAALDLDRVAMAKQKDPWGNEYLDLRPAVLVTAVEIEGTARVINAAQYDPDTTGKLQRPNIANGLFRDIVGSPRVTTPRRYLFADPSIAPVLEVAFLEGQTSPVLETKDGWDVDGAEMKVRFDYGVKDVDYRGAITNAGQ